MGRMDGKVVLVTGAVLYLASDEARYVTGLVMNADAGFVTKVA